MSFIRDDAPLELRDALSAYLRAAQFSYDCESVVGPLSVSLQILSLTKLSRTFYVRKSDLKQV